ncbi:MFS transporter [Allokutzneria albata]|uniref:Amidohydrolase family protein n=1 Tax=Allokutzneria albata TaxID=211114 RepID=A0A1G9SVW7_ALLAB|nr:MFS transporter [Allokutzneria albata]SDM39571.1 Amidohydrolase family protein [Allokutzneria albata]
MGTTADTVIAGVVHTAKGSFERGAVFIRDGVITEAHTGDLPDTGSARLIDVGESYVLPGVVDAHVHSYSHAGEGLRASTSAAAAGGVTTIVEMPFDASRPINTVERLKTKLEKVDAEAVVDVALLGTLEPGGGWRRAEDLVGAGVVGFKVSLFDTDPIRFPRINDGELLDVSVLWTVCVYALVIYLPTYYRDPAAGLGFTSQQSFLASLVGNVVLVIGCIVAGRAADQFGPRRVLTWGASGLLVIPLLCLLLLHAVPSVPVLVVVHSVLCANVAAFVGVAPSTMPRVFPASVRTTGLALSYNVAAIFFAGFTPALLTWAIARFTVYAPALWVTLGVVACLASLPALFRHIDSVNAAEESHA